MKMTAARGAADVRPEIATTSRGSEDIAVQRRPERERRACTRASAGTRTSAGTWARQGTLRLRARTGRDPLLAISRGRAHAVGMLGAGLDAMMRTA